MIQNSSVIKEQVLWIIKQCYGDDQSIMELKGTIFKNELKFKILESLLLIQ